MRSAWKNSKGTPSAARRRNAWGPKAGVGNAERRRAASGKSRSTPVVNARVALITAQHDRVVASYTLLAAVGGLSMPRLGLNVLIYDPQVHYQQVRDAWVGVRNPDGR